MKLDVPPPVKQHPLYVRPDKTFAPAIDDRDAADSSVANSEFGHHPLAYPSCKCQNFGFTLELEIEPDVRRGIWKVHRWLLLAVEPYDLLAYHAGVSRETINEIFQLEAKRKLGPDRPALQFILEANRLRKTHEQEAVLAVLGSEDVICTTMYEFYGEAKDEEERVVELLVTDPVKESLQRRVNVFHTKLASMARRLKPYIDSMVEEVIGND